MRDIFLSTQVVPYRMPPSDDELALLRQHEELLSIADPTDEQSEELAKLSAEQVIVDEYNFTVSSYSVMQSAQRGACLSKARQWFQEQTGITWADHYAVPFSERDELTNDISELVWAWSCIIPGILKIEQRKIDMLGDYKSEWEVTPIPDTWKDVAFFVNSLKSDLVSALASGVYALNPSLLGIKQDEISKKFGVVSGA